MSVEGSYVGLDVHKRSVSGVVIDAGSQVVARQQLSPDPAGIEAWLREFSWPVRVAYEAGPTGYGLVRHLSSVGIECVVAAPSKIARPVGDRVKTDGRDAELLARLLRVGQLRSVAVPSIGQESARDLVRARDDARADLMRARHRVNALMLRHGRVWSGGTAWTLKHLAWLNQQQFDLQGAGTQRAFDTALAALSSAVDRRDQLDEAIKQAATGGEYAPMVARLGAMRGVSTLTGFGLAVEIGPTAAEWSRFSGSSIAAFVGLVPSEYSSGGSRSQGGITKTGNSHVRRLLIEAGWHHRSRYRPSATLRARWRRVPAPVAARGHVGNRRLAARWARFDQRGKKPVVADTAIARELAGWLWSLATLDCVDLVDGGQPPTTSQTSQMIMG